jgi:hypothetical protein
MAQIVAKDWGWIKAQFETGLSFRQIADLYKAHFPGESCTPQSIHAYAQRRGWKRGKLACKMAARTARKVKQLTAKKAKSTSHAVITNLAAGRGASRPDSGKTEEQNEEEVLEINSGLAADVELKHRDAGNATLSVALKILRELDVNAAVAIDDGTGELKISKMTLGGRAKAVKDLAYTIDKAIGVERKSWNLDKTDGSPGGAGAIIQVNINVPEPKPLPERFR